MNSSIGIWTIPLDASSYPRHPAVMPDTDGDDLPDWWEEHWFGGISVHTGADFDDDFLADEQEFQFGTNPTNWDTDEDGLPEAIEVYGTLTDPVRMDAPAMVDQVNVNGVNIAGSLGVWARHHGTIYCAGDRGYVEYRVYVPVPDVYRLEVEGQPHQAVPGSERNRFRGIRVGD